MQMIVHHESDSFYAAVNAARQRNTINYILLRLPGRSQLENQQRDPHIHPRMGTSTPRLIASRAGLKLDEDNNDQADDQPPIRKRTNLPAFFVLASLWPSFRAAIAFSLLLIQFPGAAASVIYQDRSMSMHGPVLARRQSNESSPVLASPQHGAGLRFEAFLIPLLVLISGICAGLTIGYMSLDNTQLAVLSKSGTPQQQKLAKKIAPLRKDGHLLLITLLIANMIANEALPIVSENVMGGGLQAVIISTVLVIVFSEIIPQTVCATYGLQIGAACARPVQMLVYIFYPIAWPISRLLSKVLGEHSGTMYRRAELKELVSLHGRDGQRGGDLANDVVTIVGAAIDLQERVVQDAMTPLNRCFMLPIDTRLNYSTMTAVVESGHSRIPVYENSPAGPRILGALLTKQLILIDPEDGLLLRDFPLNPLPLVPSDMPLLHILNSFQEGRSHLAVVCPRAKHFASDVPTQTMMPPASPATEAAAPPPTEGLPADEPRRHWWSWWTKKARRPVEPAAEKTLTGTFSTITATIPYKPLLTEQPMGIITLEDVLEELLGEQIYDETDPDERGHIAVPPYVPQEAAEAVRRQLPDGHSSPTPFEFKYVPTESEFEGDITFECGALAELPQLPFAPKSNDQITIEGGKKEWREVGEVSSQARSEAMPSSGSAVGNGSGAVLSEAIILERGRRSVVRHVSASRLNRLSVAQSSSARRASFKGPASQFIVPRSLATKSTPHDAEAAQAPSSLRMKKNSISSVVSHSSKSSVLSRRKSS